MNYLIYKITNKKNGKIYVGAHATNDINDSYMGSGVNVVKAINKHGIENFVKEILHVFITSEEMYQKEAEIVDEAFVMRTDTYNAALGGRGNPVIVALQEPGYREMLSEKTKAGMTPEVRARLSKMKTGVKQSIELVERKRLSNLKFYEEHGSKLKGRKLSEEHKIKIKTGSNKGERKIIPIMIKGIEFENTYAAADYFNVSRKSINNWIRDTNKPDCYNI